ncbi:DUF6577 family protein [Pinibacter soli]|uniref:Transcriptional regulator n=1 Tax=Pinibacter soli TaxID=3044211 RepID=A0ABT6RIM1_9BACT|nr:DUF6577 family protein [Pinibacter soli]MDI3322421.1 hypothetical protein [Pinibacter soli]
MKDYGQIILNVLQSQQTLSKRELFSYVYSFDSGVNLSSFTWKLHQLKKQGLINSPSQGIYSIIAENNFTPAISSSLKRIHNKISKEFPYVQICVWDSRWFNDLMLHQLFRYYLVIEVEKNSAEAVFNSMTDVSKKVFLNPTEDIFNMYIANFNEVIIVQPLISESPIIEQEGVRIASLEKLLVDCVADKDLFAAQQSEIDFIFKTARSKYSINTSKIKRYARRRNQLDKIESLLNKTLANK